MSWNRKLGRWVTMYVTWSWEDRSRWRLDIDWWNTNEVGIVLSRGHEGSDQLLSVDLQVTDPPGWLRRIADRRWDAQVERSRERWASPAD